jgi:hypothetical protein
VQVVRVDDAQKWHMARARNAGAAVAQTEWLGFFDADVVLPQEFFAGVLPRLKAGHFFLTDSKNRNSWGSCLVERRAFEAVGGYDEAMTGYGGEDNDFYDSLSRRQGARADQYSSDGVCVLSHPDAMRLKYLDAANRDREVRIAYLYRTIKFDFFQVTGTIPDLEDRRALLKSATQMVEAAASGRPVPMRFQLPARPLWTSPPLPIEQRPRLRASLRYEIEGYGTEQADDTRSRD